MESYETLSEATKDLHAKGFTEDFNTWDSRRLLDYIKGKDNKYIAIVDFIRFEGTSDMGSNTILYVLETSDGTKGVLVDAYGTYAGQTVDKEVCRELAIKRRAYESGETS